MISVHIRKIMLLMLALVLIVPSLPAHAAGAQTFHFRLRNLGGDATFESTDSSGCINTYVVVFVSDSHFKTAPGQPVARSTAFMIIDVFDSCTDTFLRSGFGFAVLSPDEFQIDKKLTSATLNTTMEVFDDLSGTSLPVDVSLSWTGTGDTVREQRHSHVKMPGFILNSHSNGTSRNAVASGTVSDGTTNFTPEPAVSAGLAFFKEGEVVIEH